MVDFLLIVSSREGPYRVLVSKSMCSSYSSACVKEKPGRCVQSCVQKLEQKMANGTRKKSFYQVSISCVVGRSGGFGLGL